MSNLLFGIYITQMSAGAVEYLQYCMLNLNKHNMSVHSTFASHIVVPQDSCVP